MILCLVIEHNIGCVTEMWGICFRFYVQVSSGERVKFWSSQIQHKQIDLINEDIIDIRTVTCVEYGPNLVHTVQRRTAAKRSSRYSIETSSTQ